MKKRTLHRVLSVFMALMMVLSTITGDGFTIRASAQGQTYVTEEDNLAEATSAGDTTSGDTTSGDTSGGDISDGDTSGGDTSDGDASDGDASDGDASGGDVSDGDESFLYRASLLTSQEYQQLKKGKQTEVSGQEAEGNTIEETLEALVTEDAAKGSLYVQIKTNEWLPEELSEELTVPECFGGLVLTSGVKDGTASFDDIEVYPVYELIYITTDDQWTSRSFAKTADGFVEFQWDEEKRKDVPLEEGKTYTEEELLESVKECRNVSFQLRTDHLDFHISSISLAGDTELVFGGAWVSATGNCDVVSNSDVISVQMPENAGQNAQFYFYDSMIAAVIECPAVVEGIGVDLNFQDENEITGFTGAANISFLEKSSEDLENRLRVFSKMETAYVKTVSQDIQIQAPTGWLLLDLGKYNPSIKQEICYSTGYTETITDGVTQLVRFEEEKEDPGIVSYFRFENENDGKLYRIDENGYAYRDKTNYKYRGALCEKAALDKIAQGEDADTGLEVYADTLDELFTLLEEEESDTATYYAVITVQNWLDNDQWEELVLSEKYRKVLFLADAIWDEDAGESYKASYHLTKLTMENGTNAEFRADVFVDDTYEDTTDNALDVETSGEITETPVLSFCEAGVGGKLNISGDSLAETVKLEIVDNFHARSIESTGEVSFLNQQQVYGIWVNLRDGFTAGKIGSVSLATNVCFYSAGIPQIALGSVKDTYEKKLTFEISAYEEITLGVTKLVSFADDATDPEAVKKNLIVNDNSANKSYGVNCQGYAVELPGVYCGWLFSSAEAMDQFLKDWNAEGITTIEEENLQTLLDQIGALEGKQYVVVTIPGNDPEVPETIKIPSAIQRICFDLGGYDQADESGTDGETTFVEREFAIGKLYPQSSTTEIIINNPVVGKEGVLQVEWPTKAATGSLELNRYENPNLKEVLSGTATGELAGTLITQGELSLDFLTGFQKVLLGADLELTKEILSKESRVVLGDVYLEHNLAIRLPEGITTDNLPEIGSISADPDNRYHSEEFYIDSNENGQADEEEKFTSIVYTFKLGTVPLEERYRKVDSDYQTRRFVVKDQVLYEAGEDNQILGKAEKVDLDQLERTISVLSLYVCRYTSSGEVIQLQSVPKGTLLLKIGQCNVKLNLQSMGLQFETLDADGSLQQYPHKYALYACRNEEEYEQFFGPEGEWNHCAKQYFLGEKDYDTEVTDELRDLYSRYYWEVSQKEQYGDDLEALLSQADKDQSAYLAVTIYEDLSEEKDHSICFPASATKVCVLNSGVATPIRELKLKNSDAQIYLQELNLTADKEGDTLQVVYADKKGAGTVTFQNCFKEEGDSGVAVKVTAANATKSELSKGLVVGTLIFRDSNIIGGLTGAARIEVYEGLQMNSTGANFDFPELVFVGESYMEVRHAATTTFRIGKVVPSPLENHWVQFKEDDLKLGTQLVTLEEQWGASADTIEKLRCGTDDGRIDKDGRFTYFFNDDLWELEYAFPYVFDEGEKVQQSIYVDTNQTDRTFTADDFGFYEDSAGTKLIGRPDELISTTEDENLKLELVFGRTKGEITEGRVYLCFKESEEAAPFCLGAVDITRIIEKPYLYYIALPLEQVYDYGTEFEKIELPKEVEVGTENLAVETLPVSEWKLEGEYNPTPEETTLYSFVGTLNTEGFQISEGLDTKISLSVKVQGKPYEAPKVTAGLEPGSHSEEEFANYNNYATISTEGSGFWFTTDGSDPRDPESDRTSVVRSSMDFASYYLKGRTIKAYVPGDDKHMESAVAEFSWRAVYDGLALSVVVIEDQEYTGAAIKPVLEIYDGDSKLTLGKNYTVSYKNNVNVATREDAKAPTAIIKGKGAYAGTMTVTFNIVPKTDVEITTKQYLTVTDKKGVKSADLKNASIVVKDGKKTLKAGKDYTIAYQGSEGEPLESSVVVYTGTETDYVAVVTGMGNYSFERKYLIRIGEREDLSKAKLTLQKTKVFYEGSWSEKHQVGFTLKIGKNTYVYGTEEFAENFNTVYLNYGGPGTAKVVVSGKETSPYGGAVTASYSIERRKLSTAKFGNKGKIADQKYTGQEITLVNGPEGDYFLYREVDKNGVITPVELTEGNDYTVTYLKNQNAGTATVIFTALDSGLYAGSVKKTFKITKAQLASKNASTKAMELGKDFTIQVADKKSGDYTILENAGENNGRRLEVVYNPNGVMPEVSVFYGNRMLKAGKDYKVTYKNNKAISTLDAYGKIKKCGVITITGIGNYQGTLTGKVGAIDGLTFWVQPCDLSKVDLTLDVYDAVYKKGNTVYKPAVTVGLDGKKLKGNTDYTVTYKNNTNEGIEVDSATGLPGKTYTRELVITGKGNYTGTLESEYRIVPQTFDKLVFSIDKQEFNGEAVTLSAEDIHIKVNKKATTELVLGRDYVIVGYEKNQAAGTAKVLLRGTGIYPGTKKVSFTIAKPKK